MRVSHPFNEDLVLNLFEVGHQGVACFFVSSPVAQGGWQVDRLMNHHEFEDAQESSRDDEVGVLAVCLELCIGVFQSFGTPIAHLGGSLYEVVLENEITAFAYFATSGGFVRTTSLFHAWDDACVGAEFFEWLEEEGTPEFGIDASSEDHADAGNTE